MPTVNLFSYGTLQLENVQITNYGRRLTGQTDELAGYRLSMVEITDQSVVGASGLSYHPMISFTGCDTDRVKGTIFEISAEELQQTDLYEVSEYRRIQVTLHSGKMAWVYVDSNTEK